MSDPCRCLRSPIGGGHDGHCCLIEMRDTDGLPPCHPDEWRQLAIEHGRIPHDPDQLDIYDVIPREEP